MKHARRFGWIVRLIPFALAGVVLSVMVCWMASMSSTPRRTVYRFVVEADSGASMYVVSEGFAMREARSRGAMGRALPVRPVPWWSRTPRELLDRDFSITQRVYGFPMPQLGSLDVYRFNPASGAYELLESASERGPVAPTIEVARLARRFGVQWTPNELDFSSSILWRGMIVNSAMWALVLYGLFGLILFIRRSRARARARQGRCAGCGYNLAGLDVGAMCPECGAPGRVENCK